MIIVIGIFLIEPLINIFSSKTITPQLAVLMDISKSMGVRDRDVSRISSADKLTHNSLSKMKAGYRIFAFSTNLSESNGIPTESNISGDATSIDNALKELSERKDFENYGAALIVTDGRQNLGEDPLENALKMKIPIYSLTVGERKTEKNLAIDNIIYPSVTYSGADFKVEVELSAGGLQPGKAKIFDKLGSTVVADRQFDIPEEGRTSNVEFILKAPEPGNYEYALTTPILDGESNTADNERAFAVRVLKNKLKVFLGTSSLDWEYKFIKQALANFEEFETDAVYPESRGDFSAPGIPQGIAGLKKYDIVIIVNSSPAELRMALPDLKKYMDDGGSLIYVGGGKSPNDIRQFGDLLPLKATNPKISKGEFFFEPAPTRKQHAAILLTDDPDQSARLWRSLPPFGDLITGIEPTGTILLEAASSSSDSMNSSRNSSKGQPEIRPVLTVGSIGKGRVAAITGFPWWQSYFGSAKDQGDVKTIPDFWKNMIRWASATDQMEKFKVTTDHKVYKLGEPVRLTGYVYDEANRPKNGAYISISIYPDSNETNVKDVVLPPVENGIYSEEVSSLSPGHYSFRGIATAFGDTIGKTKGNFTIENFSLEMASSAPDYNLTRRISEATGGKAYTVDDFPNFANQLKLTPYVKENQASIKPFGMPLFLIILIAGLCLEWGLRKKFRLP
jgi:hypothetical protein